MNREEAIEILKKRVEIDRKLRQNSTESDYDKFCENECIAIETLIEDVVQMQNNINKEHQSGYSQGVYDSSEAWKEKIKEKIEETYKEIEHQKLHGNVAEREKLEFEKEIYLELLEDK